MTRTFWFPVRIENLETSSCLVVMTCMLILERKTSGSTDTKRVSILRVDVSD